MSIDLNEKKESCTSVIIDIRNFSETFRKYQIINDNRFYEFLNNYYNISNTVVKIVSTNSYISSTGDGSLTIFKGYHNHLEGYAYSLIMNGILTDMINKFNHDNNENISFGIGSDSGNIWKIGREHLTTYVGTVINRSARIQELTKMFDNTMTIIGNTLYKRLIKKFYLDTYNIMEEYNNYDELLNENPEYILISKKLLLQYLSDMELKGIDKRASLFRLSASLYSDKKKLIKLLSKLIGDEKIKLLKENGII